jgi:uncharacterized protein YecT (DUF1311 family)
MAKIAISYRRSDSEDITGRIFDRLVQQFGKQTVFRDIDNIRPGIDFRTQIAEALRTTDVLLVIIGSRWFGGVAGGQRRMDDEADPVRIEVETALSRDIPIIPVLVGGTEMPKTRQLPESLRDLAYRHAVRVDSGRDFDHHVEGLIRALDQFSGEAFEQQSTPTPTSNLSAWPAVTSNQKTASRGVAPPQTRPSIMFRVAGPVTVGAVLVAALLYEGIRQYPRQQPIAESQIRPQTQPTGELQKTVSVPQMAPIQTVVSREASPALSAPVGATAPVAVSPPPAVVASAPPPPAQQMPDTPVQQRPFCASPDTVDEREICQNAQLSALDLQLQNLFNALINRLSSDKQIKLRAEEQMWVRQRRACLTDDSCLLDTYRSRIAQLRLWQ